MTDFNFRNELIKEYVRSRNFSPKELHDYIRELESHFEAEDEVVEFVPQDPPIPIEETVHDDYIVSLEDGKHYKVLKRHLRKHGLTPAAYRLKWGLPYDYPMVCKSYSKVRSDMALKFEIGKHKRPSKQEVLTTNNDGL
jgi:predicted transcriptional regulator